MKNSAVVFGLLALIPLAADALAAGSMIEVGNDAASSNVLTVERLREAIPTAADRKIVLERAHSAIESSSAMDATVKAMMHESVEEILSSRVIDLQVTFLTGFPDLASFCLEGHPVKGLAIDACANTLVIAAGFSASVKYRWDLFVKMTQSGNVHQLSAGPGVGAHVVYQTAWMGGSGGTYASTLVDGMASLEYVYWLSKHFGLTAQLDLGASYVVHYADPNRDGIPVPYGKLSVGLAF